MTDIVFARTQHTYDSYTDYWRLVELAGFDTCYIDEIDPSDASKCYIVTPFNDEWVQGWKKPKARIILWDLEWHTGDSALPAIPGVSEVWASDSWYARQIGAKYVPMGSDARLAEHTAGQAYDVALLAYMTYRRSYLYDRLTVSKSPTSAWGQERAGILSNARVYLHIHQHDDVPTIAPLRMVVAAAYKLPVISEAVVDQGVFAGKLITERYGDLVTIIPRWLQYPQVREYGEALYRLLCEDWTFEQSVRGNV